jgi:hypothetical protein
MTDANSAISESVVPSVELGPDQLANEVPGQETKLELETVSPTGDNPSADGQVTTKPSVTVEEDGYDTDLEIQEEREKFDASGLKVYREQCEALRIVPVSFFVRNMQKQEIDLKHHGLGPKEQHKCTAAKSE